MDDIKISYEFAEKYLRFANPLHTQVFLYIKYLYQRDGKIPPASEIASELDIAENRIKFALGFWVSEGELIKIDDDTYDFPLSQENNNKDSEKPKPKRSTRRSAFARPSYSSDEIDKAAEKNQSLSGMFYQAESIFGDLLSGSDIELLYSFYDWLGLPCEVIVMLLDYAAKRGKTGKRYLETVAIDWAEKGINTFEKAEEHIMHLEELETAEYKIRSILGIYDRSLTQTEKKYIKSWTEMGINPDLVTLAYDRTVKNTGKLSYSYMNKILTSWNSEGIKDENGVKQSEELFGLKNGIRPQPEKNTAKSKFNNYTNTNKTDYASLEEKLLDMMLDT